jgi:hypothetical protein
MNITNFNIPKTNLCVVVWYRNNVKNETLITTPQSNAGLVTTMFNHCVGASEIRAVKPVVATELFRGK